MNLYIKDDNNYFLCWKTDEYMLYGIPVIRNAINENTTCLSVKYYLKRY